MGTQAAARLFWARRLKKMGFVQFPLSKVVRLSALLALGLTSTYAGSNVRAESPAGFAAAMGIASSDGTVRTTAGVHLTLVGTGDIDARTLEGARSALQTRMSDVRRCFSAAMQRSAGVDGSVVLEMATARGRVDTKLKSNASGDAIMAECMRSALGAAGMRPLSAASRLEATLTIDNPVARLRRKQAQRSVLEDVRMLGGGMAESVGGTQEKEVGFRVVGSAYASHTIGGLNEQFKTNLPGLLDCRRKASRKTRTAEGSVSMDVSIEGGKLSRVKTKSNSMNDRRAQACISTWLARVDATSLASAELDVTVSFAR
jgi:hypothetical protein